MSITNFDEVTEKLREFLPEYLKEHEINTSKPFNCIHPEHSDSTPSCGLLPGNLRWHCFSCHRFGDIFDAVQCLEGKSYRGHEYIQNLVIPLAKKYGIDVKERELAPEELYRIDTFNAYRKAADYISAHPTAEAIKEMERRSWKPPICAERGIGSVDSTQNFIDYLISQGYNSKFLDDIDLTRGNLFNPHHLIFTVCDEKGRPCGFAAKNLTYDPLDKTSFKYINSRNTDTDVKCNIYDKGKRLYNLHCARKFSGSTYIFEGYGDVETAVQQSLENVVCIGGTAFTEHHVLELKRLGKINIILCLDGDEAGLKKMNKIVDTFTDYREFNVKIVLIPELMDPDDYIRQYGIDKFRDLKLYSCFEWKLSQYDDRVDPVIISDEMIKIIAAESSSRKREEMAEVLAGRVPYSKNAILDDVEKLINVEEQERESRRKLALDQLQLNLRQYPSDWRINIYNAQNDLEAVDMENSEEVFSPEAFIKDLQEFKTYEEKNESSVKGYNLGDWSLLQEALNGDWDSTLGIVGGAANRGKTGWMANLAMRLVEHNREKDVMVLFQSIDDTIHQFSNRIVCLFAQRIMPEITLNMIKNPNGFPRARAIHLARDKGYEQFTQLAADGRFIIRGGEQRGGNTIKFAHDWIKYNKKKYPNRKIIYFLDNFHRLRDFSGEKEERIRFKKLSNSIKDIAKIENIPIWCTVEYTKAAGITRPNNSDISESVAMEYDANFMMHIYNELHAMRENALKYFESPDSKGQMIKMPTIEGIVGKNKITEFKSSLFWDFYTDQSKYLQVSHRTIEEREAARTMDRSTTIVKPQQYEPFRRNA